MAEIASEPGRARATSLLVVVFLIGAVCGAAVWIIAERVLEGPRVGLLPPHRPPFERIARQLDLDENQRREIRRILERSGLKVREALDEAHDEIRDLLTPEQRERFDAMRSRHRRPGSRRHPPGPRSDPDRDPGPDL